VPLDSARIATLTAELMDELDEAGIDGEIVDALIVLEIDDGENSLTRLRCTSKRGVVGLGLANTATALYHALISVETDDED
jgi:hypothetical protein